MEASRPLFIPVILGTTRMGRMSQHAAQLVTGELRKCEGVQTELIDIAKLPLPTNDAGEAIKQADFSKKMNRADAVVVVSPAAASKSTFTKRSGSWACRLGSSAELESSRTCSR
jgi:NADPH-dependent FMN reductase